MLIQHDEQEKGGRFFVSRDGIDLAEMTYVWAGHGHFIIEHTEVDSSLGGKGIGKQLVEAGVAFAREKGVTIRPFCPYAKKVLEHTAEYADVLFKS